MKFWALIIAFFTGIGMFVRERMTGKKLERQENELEQWQLNEKVRDAIRDAEHFGHDDGDFARDSLRQFADGANKGAK